MTEGQKNQRTNKFYSKLTSSCFQSGACGRASPSTEREIQAYLPPENQLWENGLNWKGTAAPDIEQSLAIPLATCPGAPCPPKLSGQPLSFLSIARYSSTMRSHRMKTRATNVREQQGTTIRFLPSRELTLLQEYIPANSDRDCKSRPHLSQPAQLSMRNSKSFKSSLVMESGSMEMPSQRH